MFTMLHQVCFAALHVSASESEGCAPACLGVVSDKGGDDDTVGINIGGNDWCICNCF